jgi:hypothetical protein
MAWQAVLLLSLQPTTIISDSTTTYTIITNESVIIHAIAIALPKSTSHAKTTKTTQGQD